MKIVDANVLLYAVDEAAAEHRTANAWLSHVLAGQETVAFAWVVLLAFLRVSTLRDFAGALTFAQAAEIAEAWLAAPAAVVVQPTPRHLDILRGLLHPLGSGGNLVSDAHLAALAMEHNADVISFDRDFGRFGGLRWSIPKTS
jgi:toxin-antitoxin system PIN domain toxin